MLLSYIYFASVSAWHQQFDQSFVFSPWALVWFNEHTHLISATITLQPPTLSHCIAEAKLRCQDDTILINNYYHNGGLYD